MKYHQLTVGAAVAFLLLTPFAHAGNVKGCCQSAGKTRTSCGAPVKVLGKETCTLGYYKVKCDKGYTNCKKETWATQKMNLGFGVQEPVDSDGRSIGNRLHTPRADEQR